MTGRMNLSGEFAEGRELLSLKEAADFVGKSEVTLRRWAVSGFVRCWTKSPGKNGNYIFSRTGLLRQFGEDDKGKP